jgi:hypothetical protein
MKRSANCLRFILSVFLGVFFFASSFIALANSADEIQTKIEIIRKNGDPITPQQLDSWYTTLCTEKKFPDFLNKALARFDSILHGGETLPIVGKGILPKGTERFSEDTKKQIDIYLAANREILELLQQAAFMGDCRYPIDLSKGFETLTLPLTKQRGFARLLYLKAAMDSENGHSAEAVKSIASIFGLANSIKTLPIPMAHMVRLVLLDIGVSSIKYTLNYVSLANEELKVISNLLTQAEESMDLVRPLIGERCNGNDIFNMSSERQLSFFRSIQGGTSSSESSGAFDMYRQQGLLDKDHLYYLEGMEKIIATSRLSFPERLDAMQELTQKIDGPVQVWKKTMKEKHTNIEDLSDGYLFSAALFPAILKLPGNDARYIALLRTARAALAIEQYRSTKKTLPESLDEASTQNIIDPFDGKPLRYQKLPKGYLIYSVGADRLDNHGWEQGNDIPFAIERE